MDTKKFLIASVAVFVVISIFGFVFHEVLLAETYKQTAAVWRPEMKSIMGLMWIGSVIFSLMFTLIYTKGFEKGKNGLAQGIRYGIYIWLLTSVAMSFGWYVVLPIPAALSIYWVIGGLVESILAGAAVGLIYKK